MNLFPKLIDVAHKRLFTRLSKMSFIKEQEKRLALRYLTWQYEKRKLPLPPQVELEQHAARIIDEAHRTARARGRNVILIIKEMIADLKK